jgi:hypothetical protein
MKDAKGKTEKAIKVVLLGILGQSVWSIYKVGISPIQTPSAPNLSKEITKSLQDMGWGVSKVINSQNSKFASSATGLDMSKQSNRAGNESTRLLIVPVRMRDFSLLGVKNIRKYGTFDETLNGNTLTIKPDQFEMVKNDHGINYMSTCVTKNGFVSSNPLPLRDAIKTEAISLSRRVEILLGTQPPRDWSCLYVELSSRTSTSELLDSWIKIRPVIANRWFAE